MVVISNVDCTVKHLEIILLVSAELLYPSNKNLSLLWSQVETPYSTIVCERFDLWCHHLIPCLTLNVPAAQGTTWHLLNLFTLCNNKVNTIARRNDLHLPGLNFYFHYLLPFQVSQQIFMPLMLWHAAWVWSSLSCYHTLLDTLTDFLQLRSSFKSPKALSG